MAFDEAAFGNSVIVELLEMYLQEAKDKPFGFVGLVMMGMTAQNQPIAAIDWAGAAHYEEPSLEAVDLLKQRLVQQVLSWKLPPPNPDLDDSYVVWNLAHGPLGFDFIPWLVNVEMVRRRSGAPGPLKIGFYLGKNPIKALATGNRDLWLNKVYRPAMDMIGAVEDPINGIFGHDHQSFTTGPIVKGFKAGEQVPLLSSGLPPRRPGCVTITLREAKHWVMRNSKFDEWMKFADYLKECGEEVVIVRDTLKADEPLEGYDTDPEASVELKVRASLYEGAKCNLCAGGGPWQLMLFGAAPWLSFIHSDDDPHGYTPNSTEVWRHSMGIQIGQQFPWQTENQRIVWLDDTYDNIRAAWESLPLNHLGNRRYGT
jgi:hypothetical protein